MSAAEISAALSILEVGARPHSIAKNAATWASKAGRTENHHAFAQDACLNRCRMAAPVMDHDAAIGV
jgi:hypothetical protein